MFKRLKRDIQVIFERDPAARSVAEVLLCYPGLHAIWFYRVSHYLYLRGWILLPRLISNFCRFLTGIEIHPGAIIGEGLFIDHGTGLVIGETTELGHNVTLFQGVTLGGTGKEKGKRHPTIGNHVVIGSGAKVLGSLFVGDHAKIGAGSVVLKDVPPYATVVGIPGAVVCRYGEKTAQFRGNLEFDEDEDVDLDHNDLPDPVAEMLMCMQRHIDKLETRIEQLEMKIVAEKEEKEEELTQCGNESL